MSLIKSSQVIDNEKTDIPIGLIQYIEKRTQKSLTPIHRFQNRYSVTDIVKCKRKNYYKTIGTKEEIIIDDSVIETMCDTVRGELLHQITYAYKWRELDTEYEICLNNKTITIAARLNIYNWKTSTIIDLKTTKFLKWQIKNTFVPKSAHILPLQCYYTIFSKIIPIKNLTIGYL